MQVKSKRLWRHSLRVSDATADWQINANVEELLYNLSIYGRLQEYLKERHKTYGLKLGQS